MGDRVWIGLLLLLIVSCSSVTLPIQEYTLARSALEAAEQSDAERLTPLLFQQAQQLYKQAESHYKEREYEEARVLFIKSRKASEKAENTARIKKSKTGEVL
jgi:hypothetical protein